MATFAINERNGFFSSQKGERWQGLRFFIWANCADQGELQTLRAGVAHA